MGHIHALYVGSALGPPRHTVGGAGWRRLARWRPPLWISERLVGGGWACLGVCVCATTRGGIALLVQGARSPYLTGVHLALGLVGSALRRMSQEPWLVASGHSQLTGRQRSFCVWHDVVPYGASWRQPLIMPLVSHG